MFLLAKDLDRSGFITIAMLDVSNEDMNSRREIGGGEGWWLWLRVSLGWHSTFLILRYSN